MNDSPPTPPAYFYTQPGIASIGNVTGPQNLIIACGKGTVSISMSNGRVTLKDCTLDDGSKAFWNAVESLFPKRKP